MSGPHTDPESIAELQARLHEAEARLHSLGRNLPGSVLFQSVREPDAQRHFAYIGEGIERLTGLAAAQFLADFGAFYRLIDPEDFPAYKASVDHSYHTLETVETQFRIHRTDGELRWIRLSATPRRLGEDRVIWDGLLTDITGQIRAEAAARAYETQLAGVLRHLPGAVARLGLGLEILYVNQTQAQWVDTEVDQIIGKRVPEVIAPALMERMAPYFERAIRGETVVFENRIDRPDGEVRFRHTTLVPERTADGSIGSIVLFAYDLTALKNAQAEALQQKALLSSLLKAMPDMVFLKNTQGVYQACNPVFERFMGRSEREILGRTDADLLLPAAAAHFSRHDRQALQAWQPLVIEDTLVFADDGYEGRFETILTPIRDLAGNTTGLLGVARDITDRKRAEEEIRQKGLELARSNKELQDFAYVASHDLQEPLHKIIAFGDRLRANAGEALGERGLDSLERIQKAALRMRKLIDDLLQYARVTTRAKPFGCVELEGVVKEVLGVLEWRIAETGAEVEVGPLPAVQADRSQMLQLFQNIIGNALKFHKPGERPQVSVSGRVSEDGFAEIEVRDRGIGIEGKFSETIFKPFQRLHGRQEYEGTGMGLAICQKIVQRHGGEISVTGEPGAGSTFRLRLPKEPPGERSSS